jgi:vacuolar-type H+-ATPase subunit E/Vma4
MGGEKMSTERLKQKALHRISKIVDKVFEDTEVYREEIDKDEFMQHMSKRLEKRLSPEKVISINEERLTRIIRQHMAIKLFGTLLDGLTPEQIRLFNEAVEGR